VLLFIKQFLGKPLAE